MNCAPSRGIQISMRPAGYKDRLRSGVPAPPSTGIVPKTFSRPKRVHAHHRRRCLHPGNVREAILTLRPWGVDVASGVEVAPGKKHPEILDDFVRQARTASSKSSRPHAPEAASPV